ncbi:hypothetical protein GCK72_006728 [Caenorhabditis remanei]|uniref:Uncharacterized protein n=1 Tax=Caenorhabditis remanei TaxID=31234 RepID=A0A6A5HFP6_CAERE|nr:hypothetical protein GCK72_006728 [Caenorhabditis remanei]KAF1766770.1 hypothetical protein GCK72_006728 [Caenorhabditis remanei]
MGCARHPRGRNYLLSAIRIWLGLTVAATTGGRHKHQTSKHSGEEERYIGGLQSKGNVLQEHTIHHSAPEVLNPEQPSTQECTRHLEDEHHLLNRGSHRARIDRGSDQQEEVERRPKTMLGSVMVTQPKHYRFFNRIHAEESTRSMYTGRDHTNQIGVERFQTQTIERRIEDKAMRIVQGSRTASRPQMHMKPKHQRLFTGHPAEETPQSMDIYRGHTSQSQSEETLYSSQSYASTKTSSAIDNMPNSSRPTKYRCSWRMAYLLLLKTDERL